MQQLPSTSGTRDSRLWGLAPDGFYYPIPLTADLKIPVEASVSAGATTIVDGGDVTQGAKADAKATDATSAWSVIALLKGIWDLLDTLTVTVTPPAAGTSALSNVAESASNVTLLAANAARLAFTIYNDSDAALNVKVGATASATSFTARLLPRGFLSSEQLGVNVTLILDGIWDSAPGTAGHAHARVSEFTA